MLASFIAQYFFAIVVAAAIIYLLWYHRPHLVSLGLATILIGGLSYLLSKIATQLIYDPQPFVESGKAALIKSSTDNGFPSDHTLLVAIIAAVVTLANWKMGIIIWVMALLVGLARVYVGVHHLLDVLGSLAIVAIAFLLYWLVGSLWQKRFSKNQPHSKLLTKEAQLPYSTDSSLS